MTLDSIKIENFQSHRDTALALCPGVNVLTGTSDSGKSAVVRAVVWAAQNRPQGTGFRSTFAGKADATRVELAFADGGRVCRERDGGRLNRYRAGGLELEALRADVPAEVQAILGMSDYNVQGQHDGYFLLQSSPGEVARALNDVVGLDVIDAVLKEVNAIVADSRREADRAAVEAEALGRELEGYAFLDAVEKHVEKLDALTRERDERRAEVAALTALAADLELAGRDVRQAEAWLAVDAELAAVEAGADELRELAREREDLAKVADELEAVGLRLGRHEAVAALTERAREVHAVADERRALVALADEVDALAGREAELRASLDALAQEEQRLLRGVTACPVCLTTPLSREARDNVIGYFEGKGEQR